VPQIFHKQARNLKQQQQQPFYGPLSGATRVSRYQKKHSPTHHPDHHLIFISFFHLPRSIASSLFKLRAWQSFCTISLHVVFGLPLGLEPSTSYSIHFLIQSVSSFRNTVMDAQPNIGGILCESSVLPFLVACHKFSLMAAARVPCSNTANIEHKTWMQSEFCTCLGAPENVYIVYQPRRRCCSNEAKT